MRLRIILMWVYCHQFSHAVTFVFVPGRVNKAKYLIADAVCLIKNRGSLHAISSNSYGRETLTVRLHYYSYSYVVFALFCFLFIFCPRRNPNLKLCLSGVLFGVFVSSLISLSSQISSSIFYGKSSFTVHSLYWVLQCSSFK